MEGIWLVSYVALWVLVIVLALVILGLAREIGAIHVHIGPAGALVSDDGLRIGSDAPEFRATEIPTGRDIPVKPTDGRSRLLIFVSPNCPPCQKLLPALEAGWTDWNRQTDITVLCDGDSAQVRWLAERSRVQIPMLADPMSRVRSAYGQPPTPFAYLINSSGQIALKGIVNVREDIELMLENRARLPGRQQFNDQVSGNGQPRGIASTVQTGEEATHGSVE